MRRGVSLFSTRWLTFVPSSISKFSVRTSHRTAERLSRLHLRRDHLGRLLHLQPRPLRCHLPVRGPLPVKIFRHRWNECLTWTLSAIDSDLADAEIDAKKCVLLRSPRSTLLTLNRRETVLGRVSSAHSSYSRTLQLVMAFSIFARSGDIASPALRTVVETGSRILRSVPSLALLVCLS